MDIKLFTQQVCEQNEAIIYRTAIKPHNLLIPIETKNELLNQVNPLIEYSHESNSFWFKPCDLQVYSSQELKKGFRVF